MGDESLQRLGLPSVDDKTSVVEDGIDALREPSMMVMSAYNRAKAWGVKVAEVRVLAWNLGGWSAAVATFVFRVDKSLVRQASGIACGDHA